jgi:hypothetical protein
MKSYVSEREYNESGDNPNPPKVGSFYWVIPDFDVDFVSPEWKGDGDAPFEVNYNHWTQREQPARFAGYTAGGSEKWVYLGQKEPDNDSGWWGASWIGPRIRSGVIRTPADFEHVYTLEPGDKWAWFGDHILIVNADKIPFEVDLATGARTSLVVGSEATPPSRTAPSPTLPDPLASTTPASDEPA